MTIQHKHHQPSSYWVWILVFAVMLWSLRSLLLGSQVPAFRDGFHFYWPQLVWLDQAYQSGDFFPTWNANEGLGSSVSAQPTWQLYYPLRAVFFAPGRELAQRLGLFILLHLLVSLLGMLRAARTAGLSITAGWMAAIAFSFSCPVVFQINNLIYLCSAAWVACSLPALVRLMTFRRYVPNGAKTTWANLLGSILEIAGCGSMMTLCGDPHGAVNLGLIALAVTLLGWVSVAIRQRRHSPANRSPQQPPQALAPQELKPLEHGNLAAKKSTLAWVTPSIIYCCISVAIALASFKTLQSIHWYQHSNRSNSPSKYVDSFHPNINRILRDPSLEKPRNIFDFSLSPWNLPTLVWPTFNGHFQPENSRWVQAVPSESRMWVPSLYLGLIPIALAILGLRSTGGSLSIQRYLAVIALVSFLLAMGNYSIVWLLRNLLHSIAPAQSTQWLPTDGQGSLYGLLVQSLPGYSGFRYPAKWIVWSTSCLALLAGFGVDRLVQPKLNRRLIRQLYVVAFVSGLMLVGLFVTFSMLEIRSRTEAWLLESSDRLAGPADLQASLSSILRALIQSSVICVLAIAACKRWTSGFEGNQPLDENPDELASRLLRMNRLGIVLLAITLVDLGVLQSSWITTTDPNKLDLIQVDHRLTEPSSTVAPRSNFVWANVVAADLSRHAGELKKGDLQPTLELQNRFLLGKLCHLHSMAAMQASGSIEPRPVVAIRRWLQQNDSLQISQPEVDQVLAELGVSARLAQATNGQMMWTAIPNARPLVEVFNQDNSPINGQRNEMQPLQFKWLNHESLQIQFQNDQPSILVVRQFNDGDWQVQINSATPDNNYAHPMIQSDELFVSIPFPPGKFDLILKR